MKVQYDKCMNQRKVYEWVESCKGRLHQVSSEESDEFVRDN